LPTTKRARLNRILSEKEFEEDYNLPDILCIGEMVQANFAIWGTVQEYQDDRFHATVRLMNIEQRDIIRPILDEAADEFYVLQQSAFQHLISARRAITVQPDLQFAHLILGLAYYHEQSYDDAERALLRAVELGETDITAISMLAEVYETTDRPMEASDRWEQLLTIPMLSEDDRAAVERRLALLRVKIGSGDRERDVGQRL